MKEIEESQRKRERKKHIMFHVNRKLPGRTVVLVQKVCVCFWAFFVRPLPSKDIVPVAHRKVG